MSVEQPLAATVDAAAAFDASPSSVEQCMFGDHCRGLHDKMKFRTAKDTYLKLEGV